MNHPNRSKRQQAQHTPGPFPDALNVGSVSRDQCARNHALCDGPCAVAYVLGAGYPAGIGWSQRTEDLTAEIARRYNCHADLLAALKMARDCIAYCRRSHPDAQTGEGVPVEAFIDAAIAKAEGR